MTDEAAINKALADEFDRLAVNIKELKADLTDEIVANVRRALYISHEDGRDLSRFKCRDLELVDGSIQVTWTDDGKRTEIFKIKVERA